MPDKIEGEVAQKAQTHLFLDAGITRDRARSVTEKAAGFGFGFSYYPNRITFSGAVGVPLIEEGSWKLGDPVVQVRMDVKAW